MRRRVPVKSRPSCSVLGVDRRERAAKVEASKIGGTIWISLGPCCRRSRSRRCLSRKLIVPVVLWASEQQQPPTAGLPSAQLLISYR